MNARSAPSRGVRGALFFLALASAHSSFGHDLWLVPGAYVLAPGETTRVFINNGDAFPESLTLLAEPRIVQLRRRGPDGETPISGLRVDGRSLTFDLRSEASGTHVLAMSTRARRVRLKGEDFEDYLLEEGLTGIHELLQERDQLATAAVERYQKWAKTIVDVGGASPLEEAPWAEPVGHEIEIVPLVHPNRIAPGGELPIRVLFRGEPLSGAALRGGRAMGPAREIALTTDERGEAVVKVSAAGRWFVRALHMVAPEDDPQVQWDSFWCTLTFEVGRRSE